jgi:hypothetical protein
MVWGIEDRPLVETRTHLTPLPPLIVRSDDELSKGSAETVTFLAVRALQNAGEVVAGAVDGGCAGEVEVLWRQALPFRAYSE